MPVSKAVPGKGHEDGILVLNGAAMSRRAEKVASQARVDAEPAKPDLVPAREVFVPAPVKVAEELPPPPKKVKPAKPEKPAQG